MTDVLRHQIQKEAVRVAYRNRIEAFTTNDDNHRRPQQSPLSSKLAAIPMIRLVVMEIAYHPTVPFSSILDNRYYVQIQLGKCMFVTNKLNPSPNRPLLWQNLKMIGLLPVNDIQLLDFQLEVLDENPTDLLQLASIGRGFITIDNALGVNMGREMHYDVPIFNQSKEDGEDVRVKVGSLRITLTLDADKAVSELSADPINLETFEINRKKPTLVQIGMSVDKYTEYNLSDTVDEITKNTDGSSNNDPSVDRTNQPSTVVITQTRNGNASQITDEAGEASTVNTSAEAVHNSSSDAGDRVYSLRSLVRYVRT